MAVAKVIPTYTIISVVIPAIDVTTYYQDPQLGDILNAFINDSYLVINSLPVLEGYLIVTGTNNFQSDIDMELDVNGELIVFGDEADKYDIDSNGNLTYTI